KQTNTSVFCCRGFHRYSPGPSTLGYIKAGFATRYAQALEPKQIIYQHSLLMFLFLLFPLGRLTSPRADREPAAQQAAEATKTTGVHHPHHLAHLAIFIDHFVDLLNSGATAPRDAPSPRGVQNLGVHALARRH